MHLYLNAVAVSFSNQVVNIKNNNYFPDLSLGWCTVLLKIYMKLPSMHVTEALCKIGKRVVWRFNTNTNTRCGNVSNLIQGNLSKHMKKVFILNNETKKIN